MSGLARNLIGILLVVVGLSPLAPFAQASPRPLVRRPLVVVLDPGHGGSNDGCQAFDGESHEKDLTLDLARRLRARLLQQLPQAEVILTRERDETMTLAERVAFANERGADVFLSLHANASPNRDQQGFETYILDIKASGLEAARTARRENDEGYQTPRAGGRGTSDIKTMLRELTLTAHRAEAAALASAIQREQALRFPGRLNRGVRQGPFDVLMGTRMPAVLFEVGFFDNHEEGSELLHASFKDRAVDGLATALVDFYRRQGRR